MVLPLLPTQLGGLKLDDERGEGLAAMADDVLLGLVHLTEGAAIAAVGYEHRVVTEAA